MHLNSMASKLDEYLTKTAILQEKLDQKQDKPAPKEKKEREPNFLTKKLQPADREALENDFDEMRNDFFKFAGSAGRFFGTGARVAGKEGGKLASNGATAAARHGKLFY